MFLLKNALKRALRWNHDIQVLLVGDGDQLPPIGKGQPFRDMIDQHHKDGSFKVSYLREIKRTDSQRLKQTIRDIGDKNKPEAFLEGHVDFRIHPFKRAILRDGISKILDGQSICQSDFVILTAQNKSYGASGEGSTKEINKWMQNKWNPTGSPIFDKWGDTGFREGDRVISTCNRYSGAAHVYNGMIGIITAVDRRVPLEPEATVYFPTENVKEQYAAYEMKHQLAHAWCVTVHKAQGSGFKNVIVVVSESHHWMWKNNLGRKGIYTAASRAKEKLYLIGNLPLLMDTQRNDNKIISMLFEDLNVERVV